MAHATYLTYDEYKEYGGGLSQAAFPLVEMACRKRIDYLTDSRVQRMAEVPTAVKQCMILIMALESATGANAQVENPAVTSFSTDGYSESYGNALSADDTAKQINKTIATCLYGEVDDEGVPLLYRGVVA